MECQVHDRLSFSRFLGLAIEDSISDATTLGLLVDCHAIRDSQGGGTRYLG